MTAKPVEEWRARNPHRSTPEIDFGQQWTWSHSPGVDFRLSWNVGTGELYAARCDGLDMYALAIADTFGEIEAALRGWGDHATRPGGLDWVFDQTRHLTGEGDVSLHLSRLRADLAKLADCPEPLGRDGLSVEL